MFSKTFLIDSGIRVLRTFIQTLVGALGLDGAGVLNTDWRQALAVASSAALLSALTQLASLTGVKEQNALPGPATKEG
jgi:hypothetical protein